VTGVAEVSKIKPNVRFSADLTSIEARADIGVSLSAKVWETAGAATLWTDSRGGEWSAAQLGLSSQGGATFGVSDPAGEYGRIVADLAYDLAQDFRPRFIKKRIH